MPDDRIYDAINIFKYSATGQGIANIGGDGAYRTRYRRLADRVLAKLWEYWGADEIGWSEMRPGLVGSSREWRLGCDIQMNDRLEPSAIPGAYIGPAEQGKLAATSCNIVHEAVHVVHQARSYPEEEVLCRTIQLFYFRELVVGRNYDSRVTGSRQTARFLPTTPFYNAYMGRLNRLMSRDLIDNVFNIEEYRRDLESSATAHFIARSFSWWDGLTNRWPSTRGYYLRSLAAQSNDYADKMLQILESLQPAQWPAARSCAGDMDELRRGLRRGHHIYSRAFTDRMIRTQQRLGAELGMNPR